MLNRLLMIQAALRAPKNQYNNFGKYSYRSCEDILEAVKPLLLEAGLVLLITDEVVQVGDRFYVKATATLCDAKTDKIIAVTAYAREEESKKGCDGSQVTGAASSYARKYALNGLFCIDDAKDADAQAPAAEKPAKPAKKAKVYKCADCGKVFEGCTPEMYIKVQAASPDGVARCKDCRTKMSREIDEKLAKEEENA